MGHIMLKVVVVPKVINCLVLFINLGGDIMFNTPLTPMVY